MLYFWTMALYGNELNPGVELFFYDKLRFFPNLFEKAKNI